jgi:predicted transcriptional regulator of viral defense system
MRAFPSEHHGVVARRDLLAAGVGRRAIEHALATRDLYLTYRGVYAVGRPDLSAWGRRRAIVLACGVGAVLSHQSAAGAWGLRPDGSAHWHVTVPSDRSPVAPVRIHRHPLAPDEHTVLEHVPITTISRTLLDLSSVIPAHQLRRALERATERDDFDARDLHVLLERHRRRPGTPALKALVADAAIHGDTRTRSDLEALFLQLCLDHGLPRPTINHFSNGRELDATWPGSDLIVEIDSYTYHGSRAAFVRDRAKDRQALLDGRRTVRYTGDDIELRPAKVAAELRALLAMLAP